jgi:site-specific recombinase XerD
MTLLAPILEEFFTSRLAKQKSASRHTIASYRDAWVLLLEYLQAAAGTAPSALRLEQLDADTVAAFLSHLETDRGNTAATRNQRLAAIRVFFAHASLKCPQHSNLIAQVMAIPAKRHDAKEVCYLTEDETVALARAAADSGTWEGQRDQALILTAAHTGFRVSELLALRVRDLDLASRQAAVTCVGKGRKQRTLPLPARLAADLAKWISGNRTPPEGPVFGSRRGTRLSRDAVALRLAAHARAAQTDCPSIAAKHITPHVLRHTCAMRMLQNGVGVAVVALWLGHADIRSTNPYIHADIELKRQALARLPAITAHGRPTPQLTDSLIETLQAL